MGDARKKEVSYTRIMKHKKVKEYEQNFMDEHGYIYCELCSINQSFAFSVHHIVYKSQCGNHPEINNHKNLIMVCADCHKKLHDNQKENDNLIQERGLKELFI